MFVNAFFRNQAIDFSLSTCFQQQAAELMLIFISAIDGTYNDAIFIIRFTSKRINCFIIVNIVTERELTIKDWQRKVIN